MAVVPITITSLTAGTAAAMPATVAITSATDGATIDISNIACSKLLIIAENGDTENAEEVTVKAGNGIQGIDDLTFSVAASATKVICVESGKYKNVSSTYKGKIRITASTDVKIAAIALD